MPQRLQRPGTKDSIRFIGYSARSSRPVGTGPVVQAKTGPLFSGDSVMIVALTNAIYVNVVMIVTITRAS